MPRRMFTAPTTLPDDPATLQLILRAALAEIERLRLQLAGLRRNRFGRRSEQLDDATVQQGEEDLKQSVAEQQAGLDAVLPPANAAPEPNAAPGEPPRAKPAKRNRGALPADLSRVEVIVDIDDKACPCCGGTLHVIGEDRAEMLDYVPAQFRVRVIRRPRYGCRGCGEAVVQAPAPDRPSRLTALAWHQSASRPDRRRSGDRGAARACADQQVRRSFAAVPSGPDLRPSGHDAGSFHLVRLGRPCLLVADAAVRTDPEHRSGLAQSVRRRHDAAGARSRTGKNEDRPAVVLRGR